MQQVASRPQPNPGGNSGHQTLLITAITMFALSGLLVGFAVGAFVRPASPHTNTNKPSGVVVAGHPLTPTPTPAPQAVPLGCPEIKTTSAVYTTNTELPDGTTTYTFSAQVKDKSAGTCSKNNKPILATGISCKLWLITRIPDGQILLFPKEDARLKHVDLTAPLTGTIQNTDFAEVPGLQFDQTTPQLQQCNAQGQGSWKYTIAPTTPAGNYDLVVLTNWAGKYFNWSWINLTIKADK